jgi:hypothetical protein
VVDTSKAEKKDAPCTITITMPSGKTLEMTLILVTQGYSAMFTPTEVGEHKVTVTYAEMPLPKSPYKVMVEIAIDVTRVRVRGLETRKLNKISQTSCVLAEIHFLWQNVFSSICGHHVSAQPAPFPYQSI